MPSPLTDQAHRPEAVSYAPPESPGAGSSQFCSGVNGGPPKDYVHIQEPLNVTLFGKESFADIVKDLQVRVSGLGWALGPMTSVLRKEM